MSSDTLPVGRCRGTKLTHGECHPTEHRARIIRAGLDTFLVRNAVFRGLDQILGGADNANHRKDAKRNGQIPAAVSIRERTAQAMANLLGNVTAATAAMAFCLFLADARAKDDGIDGLHHPHEGGK